MTFIVAIQLEDSVVIASDNRSCTLNDDQSYTYHDETSKLHIWNGGVITGSGEFTVIQRAVEFFVKLAKMNPQDLPKCLKISRLIRELEASHDQITKTQLLYSSVDDLDNIQLFKIVPDGTGDYTITQCEKNIITLWLFEVNVEAIMSELMDLYSNLRPSYSFSDPTEWFDFYMAKLKVIYAKQAQSDELMSHSFDYFFHAPDYCTFGHSDNIHSLA